jgi:hypothetical protein
MLPIFFAPLSTTQAYTLTSKVGFLPIKMAGGVSQQLTFLGK